MRKRHNACVRRTLVPALLVLALGARANEAADSEAIEHVIAALNDPKPAESLFTSDFSLLEMSQFINLRNSMQQAAHPVWSEQPPKPAWSDQAEPRVFSRSIHFVTADVALVDGVINQLGASPRSVPLLFVMKRDGSAWRIAIFRVLGNPGLSTSDAGLKNFGVK